MSRITTMDASRKSYDALVDKVPALARMTNHSDAWQRQIGTLGGGNHFIELCLDERNRVWVMLRSGSRGIGNRTGSHFNDCAHAHF